MSSPRSFGEIISMRATLILNLPIVSPRWVDFDRTSPTTGHSDVVVLLMPSWSPSRLDLDRAQQRCGRNRNQNASAAERDLHRTLIGDAEQRDVAADRRAFDLHSRPPRVSARRGHIAPSRSTRVSSSKRHRIAGGASDRSIEQIVAISRKELRAAGAGTTSLQRAVSTERTLLH